MGFRLDDRLDNRLDGRMDARKDQDSTNGSKGNYGGWTGKARAMMGNQVPQDPTVSEDDLSSWMKDEVCLDRKVLRGTTQESSWCGCLSLAPEGYKNGQKEILSAGIDTRFLCRNFDCLVVQDGHICKKRGPLVDSSMKVTVHVLPVLTT